MRFYKLSGSGNDFVFLDGRFAGGPDRWPAERIRQICERRSGVGADGLVILVPEGQAPDGRRRVRFHYFNADGRRTEMCGNGALCASRLSVQLQMAKPPSLILLTDVGEVMAHVLDGGGERAQIDLPDVEKPSTPNITRTANETWIRLAQAGVPHLVVRVADVDAAEADPEIRGRALRHHPEVLPAGANANFVSAGTDGSWKYRTFERGVEGETLACGTGAVAVAAALRLMESIPTDQPVSLMTRSGRQLRVTGTTGPDGALRQPKLEGEGRVVFEGEMEL